MFVVHGRSICSRTMSEHVRYRCRGCGNLTRFDVVATRRTRAFHHFSVGGDLTVEDETVLDEQIDAVECRWCGASGDAIEVLPPDAEVDVGAAPLAGG
jgi:ribosomal protein S27E